MNVRIQYPFTFTAGVHYANEMRMNHYTGRLWLVTNTYNPENHNLALERVKYYIYRYIDSSIFINQDEREAAEAYVAAGLNVTTLPDEPIDQLVGIMLHYKLSAIMEGRLLVAETEISSELGDGITYLHSGEEALNGITKPEWWESADLSHCDTELTGQEHVVDLNHRFVWRDLDLHWPEEESDEDSEKTGNVVLFADFKNNDEE